MRLAEQLQRVWEQSRGSGSGGQLEVVQLDVSRGEGVAACVRELKQRLQHLDVSTLRALRLRLRGRPPPQGLE